PGRPPRGPGRAAARPGEERRGRCGRRRGGRQTAVRRGDPQRGPPVPQGQQYRQAPIGRRRARPPDAGAPRRRGRQDRPPQQRLTMNPYTKIEVVDEDGEPEKATDYSAYDPTGTSGQRIELPDGTVRIDH